MMALASLWKGFEELTVSNEAVTSAAIPVDDTQTHLLIKGISGEPVFLLRCEPRALPRAPIRLKHVAVAFDVPFEVRIGAASSPAVARYTKFTCSPQSTALHPWFIELVSAATRRVPHELTASAVDELVATMLELFRQATPPLANIVTGLWGELLIISMAMSPARFLAAWHSAPNDVFDFSFPNARLEVKTTQSPTRDHEFALAQVSGGRPDDYVLSIIVQRSSAGASAIDLAKGIATGVDDVTADRLWRGIFATLGAELDGVEDQRFDIDVAQASLKAFRAVDVPAPVVPEGLKDIVTNVSFSVSLGAIANTMDLQRLLTM